MALTQDLQYDVLSKINSAKIAGDLIDDSRLTDDEKAYHRDRVAHDKHCVDEICSEFQQIEINNAATAHGFIFGTARHPPFDDIEMARWTIKDFQDIAAKMNITGIPRGATASSYRILIKDHVMNTVAPFTRSLTRCGLTCPPYSLLRLRILAVLWPTKFAFICRVLGFKPRPSDSLDEILHRVLNCDGNQYQYSDVKPAPSPFQRAVDWVEAEGIAFYAKLKEQAEATIAGRPVVEPAPLISDETEFNDLMIARWRVQSEWLYLYSGEPAGDGHRKCYRRYAVARGRQCRPFDVVLYLEWTRSDYFTATARDVPDEVKAPPLDGDDD